MYDNKTKDASDVLDERQMAEWKTLYNRHGVERKNLEEQYETEMKKALNEGRGAESLLALHMLHKIRRKEQEDRQKAEMLELWDRQIAEWKALKHYYIEELGRNCDKVFEGLGLLAIPVIPTAILAGVLWGTLEFCVDEIREQIKLRAEVKCFEKLLREAASRAPIGKIMSTDELLEVYGHGRTNYR